MSQLADIVIYTSLLLAILGCYLTWAVADLNKLLSAIFSIVTIFLFIFANYLFTNYDGFYCDTSAVKELHRRIIIYYPTISKEFADKCKETGLRFTVGDYRKFVEKIEYINSERRLNGQTN